jgi:cephalosporin hydroxylase
MSTFDPMSRYLTLVEGDSIDPDVVERVRASVRPEESVMLVLDSAHSRQHVLAELRAYAELVRPGGYILVQDGVMRDLADVPGGRDEWLTDNPGEAAREFVAERPDFVFEPPAWTFDESSSSHAITYCPDGWLRRV